MKDLINYIVTQNRNTDEKGTKGITDLSNEILSVLSNKKREELSWQEIYDFLQDFKENIYTEIQGKKSLQQLEDFLEDTLLLRFMQLYEVNHHFKEFLGFDVEFYEVETDFNQLDEQISINLACSLTFSDLYVDLFFIKDEDGRMVITEYIYDTEHNIKGLDKNKIFVIGISD